MEGRGFERSLYLWSKADPATLPTAHTHPAPVLLSMPCWALRTKVVYDTVLASEELRGQIQVCEQTKEKVEPVIALCTMTVPGEGMGETSGKAS